MTTTSKLQTYYLSSSEKGLSSVSTLIVGTKAAALIDPPFLIPDANAVAAWIKQKTTVPLKAIFVTHHHPDHYFSANPILEANPDATLYAAPYGQFNNCLLYTSPSPRDGLLSRMPSSA